MYRLSLLSLIVCLSACNLFESTEGDSRFDSGSAADVSQPDMTSDTGDVETPSDAGEDVRVPDDVGIDAGPCPNADLLTDPDNCGECGRRCYGDTCSDGACDVYIFAEGSENLSDIVTDNEWVYWSRIDPGAVYRKAKAGGETEILAATEDNDRQFSAEFLELTLTDVFFSMQNSGTFGHGGAVFRVSKTGGSASPITNAVSDGARDFVIASNSVWLAHSRQGAVYQIPLSGGDVERVLGKDTYDVIEINSSLYVADEDGISKLSLTNSDDVPIFDASAAGQIVSDGTMIYATGGSSVIQVDPQDDTFSILANSLPNADGLAVDSANVYVVLRGDSGSVVAIPKDEGRDPIVIASSLPSPRHITVDETDIYWTNQGIEGDNGFEPDTGLILRVPRL